MSANREYVDRMAARLAPNAWALQFHLEVDDEVAAAWAPDLPAGISLDGPDRRPVEETGVRVFGRFVALAATVTGAPIAG